MANTSTRTLRLLSLLQARRYWPGAELAERLRVSPRTLRRDIDRLRERIGRWSTVEDISATRCRVRMTADSLDWPTMALGAAGADFQVVSPPELLGLVHDWGRRFSHATPSPAAADDQDRQVTASAGKGLPDLLAMPVDLRGPRRPAG